MCALSLLVLLSHVMYVCVICHCVLVCVRFCVIAFDLLLSGCVSSRLSSATTGDDSVGPLRAPAVETSRSTLKDASGRYISRCMAALPLLWYLTLTSFRLVTVAVMISE